MITSVRPRNSVFAFACEHRRRPGCRQRAPETRSVRLVSRDCASELRGWIVMKEQAT
jgi:hypothetical protein